MERKIGILLPRSTDYPAMGFDLLDGLRLRLGLDGNDTIQVIPENIGFGEDRKNNYAKAEKLLMQDGVDVVIAYLSAVNAAVLYPLFEAAGKPFIVLDAGMNYPAAAPVKNALHISLQGIHASYLSGRKAGDHHKEMIMATSFYDGGYSGPWAYSRGSKASGGAVVNNFVSHYKEDQFTMQPFVEAMKEKQGAGVMACFSTYLASLFVNNLPEGLSGDTAFYCSSFMAEEQNMAGYRLPDARFYAHVPWASSLSNEHNETFVRTIAARKNKQANIFHLIGWEAGILSGILLQEGGKELEALATLLDDGAYESPRGTVRIHPETHVAYAPLYYTEMMRDEEGKARLLVHDTIEITAVDHQQVLQDQPEGISSGWFNNYLCT
ncbi:ABC transporter substrate-binding protein [Taibaiella helva]|uniref:ABC transporter substrate-binding protein n=1 Tax=Taibaiella helva TaxID=2301235 RepID=UPI00130094CE|nr:ABC transporter substrate-binding protein [Taibaiella helva]